MNERIMSQDIVEYLRQVGSLIVRASEAADYVERLRFALIAAKRAHYVCDDCFYSCPKSGECCDQDADPEKCYCGADAHNAKIDEALNAQ